MSKRLFMTSMTPDGKPGQVVEWDPKHEGQAVQSSVEAQQFAEPIPYWAKNDASASSAEIQSQIDALVAKLPKLNSGDRAKADHDIRVLERELRAALDREEAARKSAERAAERDVQRYGQPGTGTQSVAELAEQVAATVAAVNRVIESTPAKKNTLTWASLRADLDAKAEQAGLSKVCCSGPYLCSKCKKAKAVA